MMKIIPAIDIKDGKCVRLKQGKAEDKTIYNDNPLDQAMVWKGKGAELIHIVDLDGAFDGRPINIEMIADIVKKVGVAVEIGGGIRSLQIMEQYIQAGIERIIVGTLALNNPDQVQEACNRFPNKILVGIDVFDQKVAVHGWKTVSDIDLIPFAKQMAEYGVNEFIITDIKKDGMLTGVDALFYQDLLEKIQKPIVASGGVQSLEDIKNLKPLENKGLSGVIIGKALYEKKFDLTEAVNLFS